MYSVQVYSVHVYSVHAYSVQVYSVQVYSVQVYSVQMCSVHCTVYRCTVYMCDLLTVYSRQGRMFPRLLRIHRTRRESVLGGCLKDTVTPKSFFFFLYP